ncbi:MAG: FliM/FliN family flagellar motor switch protein [Acidobacteriaceae bacterium]|nr:FliM/FliN family flagellar motor switch protein [Acidobacteriaceae bacterium]
MNTIDQEIELFVQLWKTEFSRSVEMFTGEEAKISCQPAGPGIPDPDDLPQYLWSKQVFEAGAGFAAWTGARKGTWTALGKNVGTDRGQSTQTYLNILHLTSEGISKALTARAHWPVRCGAATDEVFSTIDSLVIFEVNVELQDESLPPLLLAVEDDAASILRSALETEGSRADASDPTPVAASSPMLARLMEIEFPLAVALGRAVLPIRDILKLTTGSLIELDRTVNDYVDLIVHGTVVARGEIVSVKGNYGVRVKEIISRQDRMALRSNS